MVRADTYSDVLALAGAWRAIAGETLTNRTPDWLLHERPSCGRGRVCLCLKSLEQVEAGTQRLAELVRLMAIAARAGPDIFRLLWTLSRPCPYLQCAWCDDADDEVNVTLSVLNGRVKEPKILKDALFDWDEATTSTEFTALRDALLSAAAQHQQRRAREISTLQTLYIYTTQQAYATVKEAVDCMLRCNSQLVRIEIEESQYSDEEDDSDDGDDISDASDEDMPAVYND
ncbi:hypothetical protein P43SY_008522 [Pythium insidiosum]|uniref:Uncharacterized protein n=1 Tax=Pythium insidiosum TaxID=114742 RepID=A0AAD5LQI1_PYTIN|nr:hypothetical protein P43SY_008522 [Pythium insidiosum]